MKQQILFLGFCLFAYLSTPILAQKTPKGIIEMETDFEASDVNNNFESTIDLINWGGINNNFAGPCDRPFTTNGFPSNSEPGITSMVGPSNKFRFHYTASQFSVHQLTPPNSLSITAFITQLDNKLLEAYNYFDNLDYLLPPPDHFPSGDHLYDVYLFNMDPGVNGLAKPDCNTVYDLYTSDPMSLPTGWTGIEYGEFAKPSYLMLDIPLSLENYFSTAVHEYTHIIQNAYGGINNKSDFIVEGTAVLTEWILEGAYPDLTTLMYTFQSTNKTFLMDKTYGNYPANYATVVYWKYLTETYGEQVIRKIWENLSIYSSPNETQIIAAIDNAIGVSSFTQTWEDYLIANYLISTNSSSRYNYLKSCYGEQFTYDNGQNLSDHLEDQWIINPGGPYTFTTLLNNGSESQYICQCNSSNVNSEKCLLNRMGSNYHVLTKVPSNQKINITVTPLVETSCGQSSNDDYNPTNATDLAAILLMIGNCPNNKTRLEIHKANLNTSTGEVNLNNICLQYHDKFVIIVYRKNTSDFTSMDNILNYQIDVSPSSEYCVQYVQHPCNSYQCPGLNGGGITGKQDESNSLLENNLEGPFTLEVYNLTGVKVHSQKIESLDFNSESIRLQLMNQLPNGLYILQTRNKESILNYQKVFISK